MKGMRATPALDTPEGVKKVAMTAASTYEGWLKTMIALRAAVQRRRHARGAQGGRGRWGSGSAQKAQAAAVQPQPAGGGAAHLHASAARMCSRPRTRMK